MTGGDPDSSEHGGLGGGVHGLASQLTLSRLLDTLSREENLPVLHQAEDGSGSMPTTLEMIEGRRRKRREKCARKKRRAKTMYLDVDGLPEEVHWRRRREANGDADTIGSELYHGFDRKLQAEKDELIDGVR